ncbi:MAG: bifunctional folylpolyglutamate synthase/dihydrofolate synthase [Lachnospiraceae bacterium]|nr:bifunctional folylpolyglutamate synthase/dihydrofolate synthase [Lachnospiraceae bacterium]
METDYREWDYQRICEALLDVPRFTKKHSLSHTDRLRKILFPDYEPKNVIHVAGTNGKGSVCNYLRGLLKKQGFSVIMFVSPHLVSMTERIVINDKPVSEEDFCRAYCKVAEGVALAEKEGLTHPTFFEYLFLMMLAVAEKEKPDYLILETGLGGALDATNVFAKPALTVITRISLDHTQYLGDTVELVAGQKAGIIKEGVPLVYQAGDPGADGVIAEQAREKNARLISLPGREVHFEERETGGERSDKKTIDFSYQSHYYNIVLSLSGLGAYQICNAATALAAYEVLMEGRKVLPQPAVCEAFSACCWPGRMEEIRQGFTVDGAHNPDGMEHFLGSVSLDGASGRRYLIFAASADKDIETMLEMIAKSGLFTKVIVTRYEGQRGADSLAICDMALAMGIDASVCSSVPDSIKKAEALKGERDVIYAAGSLYLIGEIKKLTDSEMCYDKF